MSGGRGEILGTPAEYKLIGLKKEESKNKKDKEVQTKLDLLSDRIDPLEAV